MIKLPKQDSKNRKLGRNVRATYREVGPTCPQTCEHLQSGACYAMYGHVRLHADRSGYDRSDATRLRDWLANLPSEKKVRHHVSGDFMSPDGLVDEDYVGAMLEGHRDRPDLQGWGYTHAWQDLDPVRMNGEGSLTINASCDSYNDAAIAERAGWPTTITVEEGAESHYHPLLKGKVVICPNQTHGTSCSECMLCFRDQRSCVVAFRVHGTGKRKFSERRAWQGE